VVVLGLLTFLVSELEVEVIGEEYGLDVEGEPLPIKASASG
jgi:hypothetical protein